MYEGKVNETQMAIGALTSVQSSSFRQTAVEWVARHNLTALQQLRLHTTDGQNEGKF